MINAPLSLRRKSLLTLQELTATEIIELVDYAEQLRTEKRNNIFPRRLAQKNVALIFEKRSTRTRCAFVCAAQDEGAHAECLGPDDIHLGEKESIEDTARVLGRMFDGIQFRGFSQTTVDKLAQYSGVPVFNGLTDEHHPTQALATLQTLKQHFTRLKGLHVCYLGDCRNNVANSLLYACAKVGVSVTLGGPQQLMPTEAWLATCKREAQTSGAKIILSHNPLQAVHQSDMIYTDVWVSMGEERSPQVASRLELLKPWQVTAELMAATHKSTTVFSHCLPAVKGQEVSTEVFESPHSLVFEEAENRLHTIKAVLIAMMGESAHANT